MEFQPLPVKTGFQPTIQADSRQISGALSLQIALFSSALPCEFWPFQRPQAQPVSSTHGRFWVLPGLPSLHCSPETVSRLTAEVTAGLNPLSPFSKTPPCHATGGSILKLLLLLCFWSRVLSVCGGRVILEPVNLSGPEVEVLTKTFLLRKLYISFPVFASSSASLIQVIVSMTVFAKFSGKAYLSQVPTKTPQSRYRIRPTGCS